MQSQEDPGEGGGRDVTHKRGRDSLCIRGIKSPTNWVVTAFASEISSLLAWPSLAGMSWAPAGGQLRHSPPPRSAERLLCASHRCPPSHAAEAGQHLSPWRGSFGSRRPHSPASWLAVARRNECGRSRSIRVAARAESVPRQPIGPSAWEAARRRPTTNHILSLFLPPSPGLTFNCSLVRRKSLKDAREAGPGESWLAGGLRPLSQLGAWTYQGAGHGSVRGWWLKTQRITVQVQRPTLVGPKRACVVNELWKP